MDIELQIDDDKPFIPQSLINAGVEYGFVDTTQDQDEVKSQRVESGVAFLHYINDGHERKLFFRYGSWETGTNGVLRFHASEMLKIGD